MRGTTSLAAELVLEARAEVGEGPIWDDSSQTLLWVDIPLGLVHRFDPGTGRDESFPAGQPVGAVAVRRGGGLVLALRDGFGLLDPGSRDVRLAVAVEHDCPENRMNDGKCDPTGRFWAGTMAFDCSPAAGALYRLEPDLSVEPVLTGLTISNGLAWSLDGRTLYFVDSGANGIDGYDFDLRDGTVSNCHRIVEIPVEEGLPDGLTIDADGFLWVAIWGGGSVRRYAPDGTLAAVVELPVALVTSCTFGGARLDELYVTTASADLSADGRRTQPHAGGLYRIRAGVRGLPAIRFGG